MTMIPIVENPRRRKRRRSLSPAQLAAGFGGKRYRKHRRHARRNPALATLAAANPRRRRRHRRGFGVRHMVYRRNPAFLGGITNMIDLKGAAFVAGGIVLAKAAPKLIQKVWAGAPQEGVMVYAERVAVTLAAAFAVKTFLKSPSGANQLAVGGLGYVLYDIANEYLLPQIGLAGLTQDDWVTTQDISEMSGYQPQATGISTYVPAMAQPELAA